MVRLKVADVDVTALGAVQPDPAVEQVIVADPTRGVYRSLLVRDERLVGAVLIGPLATAATLVQYYDRAARLPTDRLALLTDAAPDDPGNGSGGESLARMPGSTTICRCSG